MALKDEIIDIFTTMLVEHMRKDCNTAESQCDVCQRIRRLLSKVVQYDALGLIKHPTTRPTITLSEDEKL